VVTTDAPMPAPTTEAPVTVAPTTAAPAPAMTAVATTAAAPAPVVAPAPAPKAAPAPAPAPGQAPPPGYTGVVVGGVIPGTNASPVAPACGYWDIEGNWHAQPFG
jgi:hypothetical protein